MGFRQTMKNAFDSAYLFSDRWVELAVVFCVIIAFILLSASLAFGCCYYLFDMGDQIGINLFFIGSFTLLLCPLLVGGIKILDAIDNRLNPQRPDYDRDLTTKVDWKQNGF